MRIVDVDAHLHEPLDWVGRTNPALAAEIGEPARFMEIAGDIFGVADRAFAQLPQHQQPRDRWDLITPGFVHHLEMTDERQPDDHVDDTDPRFGAAGRLAWCDERGIDVQFLNPTFLVGPIIQVGAARSLRPDPRQCSRPGTAGRWTRSTATPTGSSLSPRSTSTTSTGPSARWSGCGRPGAGRS